MMVYRFFEKQFIRWEHHFNGQSFKKFDFEDIRRNLTIKN
jgi:hypothetical protein